jgi:hypothetical protein
MNRFAVDRPAAPAVRPQVNHKRSKSSTSLLKSIIPTKGLPKTVSSKGKENMTPPSASLQNTPTIETPIWAEFASPRSNQVSQSQVTTTSKIPLNDRSVEQEAALYTPKDYTPSKHRDFVDIQRPTLGHRERPKSEFIPKGQSGISIFESFTRTASDNSVQKNQESASEAPRTSFDRMLRSAKLPSKSDAAPTVTGKHNKSVSRDLLTMAKKGSKVMGMVAAFNSKSTEETSEANQLDIKQIDAAFEAVLVCIT